MVDVTFTEPAIDRLKSTLSSSGQLLRLEYDAEGCGCVNDGVIDLVQVSSPKKGDIEIKSNAYTCYIPEAYQVYYDEHLVVDFSSTYKMFQLKSHQRMMNPRMSFK